LAAGVWAKTATTVAPIGDPAAPLGPAFLDANGALIGAEHEGGSVAAANIGNVAAAGSRDALTGLALGAGRTELGRQPASAVVRTDCYPVAVALGRPRFTDPGQAGTATAERAGRATAQGHPLAIVSADKGRIAVALHRPRLALEGQATAIFGAVLLVGWAEATAPPAAIVATFLVDAIGGAVARSPWRAGEGRRADPAQVTAAIGPTFLVLAVGDANALAVVAIETILAETAPAPTTIGATLLAGTVGNAVSALRIGFGTGSRDGLLVAGGTGLEVVADILDTTGHLEERGLGIRRGLGQAHGEGDVGRCLAALDALEDALTTALTHATSLLTGEAVWAQAAEPPAAVITARLAPAVGRATGAQVEGLGTGSLYDFLDAPGNPPVAVVKNALRQALQSALSLGHGSGQTRFDAGICRHDIATLHALEALLAGVAQVNALPYLTKVARLAVTTTVATAVVATDLAVATTGVFTRNGFSRWEVRGPVRTDVAGHAGVTHRIAAAHVGATEVKWQVANRFTQGGTLSVTIEVLAHGFIGGARELQPVGAIGGTGPEGPVIDAETLSRHALRDGKAFPCFTHCALGANHCFTIAAAIWFTGFDAAVDAGLGPAETQVREAIPGLHVTPLHFRALPIIHALDTLVGVDVTDHALRTIVRGVTRWLWILAEMVLAHLLFRALVITDALDAQVQLVVAKEPFRARHIDVALG
jgi:hypothetical protein